jgi:hypothetical protein
LTELPTIIMVSKTSYRMFSSMCAKTTHENEETASHKTKTQKAGCDKPFSTLTQAFLVAAAIGILQDQRRKPVDSAQFIRGEYLRRDKNYEYFKQLIKSKFEVKSDADVASLMVQFAEFGVRELYDEFQKTGDIDFVRLSKLGFLDE